MMGDDKHFCYLFYIKNDSLLIDDLKMRYLLIDKTQNFQTHSALQTFIRIYTITDFSIQTKLTSLLSCDLLSRTWDYIFWP